MSMSKKEVTICQCSCNFAVCWQNISPPEKHFCQGSYIWSGDAFVGGCNGVVAGEMAADGLAVEFEVLSGTYMFVVA